MRPRLSFILTSYALLALAGCFSIVMPESINTAVAQTVETQQPLEQAPGSALCTAAR
jgi:hypothetical protein